MVKFFKRLVSVAAVAAMAASLMPASLAFDLEAPITDQTELTSFDGEYSTTSTAADTKNTKYTKPAEAYSIEFDMTINTPLANGTTSKGDRNSFSIGLFSDEKEIKTPNKGGFMIATSSTDSAVTFTWHSGAGSGSDKKENWVKLDIGTTYKMRFDVLSTNSLSLTALDAAGENEIATITGLPLRNTSAKDLTYLSVMTKARQNDQEDSVTIENARIYAVIADAFELSFNGSELSSSDVNTITYDGETLYPLTKKVYVGETETSSVKTALSSEDAPEGISVTDDGITVSDAIAPDTYSFTVKASFTDYPDTVIEYPVQLVVPEPDPNAILSKAADKLVIDTEQGGIALNEDGSYDVWKSFELPTTTSTVKVQWSAKEKNEETGEWRSSEFVSLSSESLNLTSAADMDGHEVKLEATLTYDGISVTKDFDLILKYVTTEVFYDEDFSDIVTGTLVDLGSNSNTTYTKNKGITFGCGSRSQDTGQIGMRASTDENKGTYIESFINKYSGGGYTPYIMLTRSQGSFSFGVLVSADVKYAAESCSFVITDTSNNTLLIPVPDEKYLTQWLNVTVAVIGNRASIVIKNDSGKVIFYGNTSTKIKNVKSVTTTDTTYSSFAIDNLYVADTAYIVPDSEIVEAAKTNLALDLTSKGDVYTASSDFELPEAPTGTTVSWKAMQKAKDSSEWEDSSLIAVSGSTAVIKPTKDVDDYDVKLVAEITSGDVTETKDFAIALPNPMDEINGILNNNFNVVNTTDVDADGKTITFDLKGEDMLKRDLALPLSVKAYKNTTIAWSSSDTKRIKIDDKGVATLMTSDFKGHDVTLTAVVTYKKNDITYSSDPQEFKVTMGFEADDADSGDGTMGKYRVRYDAAYEDNFDIPTSSLSNIALPEAGYFGSEFKWTSSAPTIISNTGKLTRPSTTRTVTLTADIISGSASDTAEFKVTVQGNSTSSGGGGGGGGGSSRTASSTGTINKGTSSSTISTPTSTVAVPVNNNSASDTIARLQEEALASNDLFTDISKATWARDAINGLAKAGVINGKSDTEFAPNDTVTRAEFAKMLMGAFGLASNAYTTSSFNDVPTGEWYFQFVESAYNLGIIQGTADGVFEPNALITRQDMAVMVARAALTAGKDLTEVREMLGFADGGRIASYAAEAVEQLVKAGAMNGKSDTEFAPLENATRAQAAQILFNLVG